MGRHSRTIKDGAFCVDTAKNNDLYCCGKLMDISTGNWFEYLREEVLTEGLRDIGLPERSVDFIENAMANAPEKSKTYADVVRDVGDELKICANEAQSSGIPLWNLMMDPGVGFSKTPEQSMKLLRNL